MVNRSRGFLPTCCYGNFCEDACSPQNLDALFDALKPCEWPHGQTSAWRFCRVVPAGQKQTVLLPKVDVRTAAAADAGPLIEWQDDSVKNGTITYLGSHQP